MAGALFQAVNLALGTAVYLPFVRLSDRLRERQGQRVLQALLQTSVHSVSSPNGHRCIDRPGEEGRLAKILANDLERALFTNTQLFLEYQPQVNALENHVHGVEALLRWRHPVYGLIPPPLTVALAEDIQCMDRLTLFVLTQACGQRAAWKGQVPDSLTMSVNVSPQQILDPQLPRKIKNILDQSGLTPGLLELELTESTVLELNALTVAALQQVREMGILVAIDDFGMGHTSLRYLREFQIDTIKIDRSLTLRSQGGIHAHIIRSIVQLGQTLRITVIVEGVEQPEQLAHFLDLGCHTFQGYLFSRPVSGEACLTFITRKKEALQVSAYNPPSTWTGERLRAPQEG